MIVQTVTVGACTPQTIVIGRRGTYDTMQIAFDLSYLIENYGSGTAVLAVKRSQDTSAYPAVVTQEDATLLWTVNETDTAYVGSGECQLMWYVDGGLAKTIIYPMVVMRDILQTTEEPPDGYENWIEHLTGLGVKTEQNAQEAAQSATEAKASANAAAESEKKAEDAADLLENVSATATTLEPGQPATAEYDEGVFKFGIPKGDKLTYADMTEADKDDLVQGPIKDAQDDAVGAVGTAKINAVNAVNQAGTTNKNAVTQEGTTQVNAVRGAGTTQVDRVTTEGNTQIGRVQYKGDEVIASIPSDYSDLTAEVDDLSRQISDVEENQIPELKNALETFEDGFGNLNLWGEAKLLYADRYADVAPNTGKVIYRENAYNIGSWLLEVDGTKTYTSSQPMRTLVPLQEDKETATTPTNAALTNVYSIDLNNYPNTKYLAISLEKITSTVISEGATAQSGTVYPAWLYEFNRGKRTSYNATYSSITSGSSVGLPVSNCLRKNSRLMFVAEIVSYGELEIGYATGENGTGVKYNRFIIRKNAIVPYTYYDYSASAIHQDDIVQHNLAITSGNVEVVIEELPDAKCRLTIGNNGNSFVHTFDGWVRNNRLSPYITANWSIFGKSFFSWTCTDLNKGIWLLGDSYMAYEPERWAYYLEQNGYAENVLISSFPGAWSSTNIASFETLLKYGTPKYAVWAMGMNDGGDSDSAPSANWVSGRNRFLELCEDNHITPIFCTIPTVPTVNNEQKNAWVRASGYRYIDFAKAVLATSSGAWGTGMLSGDGVHPTANGAKALYYQVLTDFPEIMVA